MDVGGRRVVRNIRRDALCRLLGERGLEKGDLGSAQEIADWLVGKLNHPRRDGYLRLYV